MSSAIERNRTHRKEKKSIEPNRTFDFRTRDLCKTDVENPLPDLRSSSYFSPECSARVFRKRRNSAKRAKQEEKEKHEKIAKIKAGDPKDMTVILLREVLMEMGVSFKSSESKANLIEKVTQARQMQNDTCDDNGLVTVTSTDSLNLHTQELREVPENSISSLFFHKNNALSSSSSTLLRARGKITLDTQELNVHEHLIITLILT